jgi:hypothetical protein
MQQKSKAWYSIAVACVSSIAMGVIAIQYADHVDKKSNRQWCQVVITLDDAYTANPPQTPAGQALASEMKRMRHDFDC